MMNSVTNKLPGFKAEILPRWPVSLPCSGQLVAIGGIIPQAMSSDPDAGSVRLRGIFASPRICVDRSYPCFSYADGTVGYCCCETVCL